jgi:aminopeptidase-like protein
MCRPITGAVRSNLHVVRYSCPVQQRMCLSDEVLISCHICHPSLANDNSSGLALATELSAHVAALPWRYSYRFLFIPGTIGSIT